MSDSKTNYNAKAVHFTVAGKEIQIAVFNSNYTLFLEALLKKVFHTVRVIGMDWPDAEAIYKQARQEIEADINLSNPAYESSLAGTADIKSVWYKLLSKDCTVLAAKAMVDGRMCTVVHNRTFTANKAHKLCATIKQAGKIDLTHWRK